jgi:hypothetical protein
MDAHRIDVLDEADRDHLILGVSHDLEFQLFPAEHRFFDEHLVHHAGSQPPGGDGLQFLDVVDQASTRAPEGVRGSDNHRVA